MSRIYEALHRAELERDDMPEQQDVRGVRTAAVAESLETLPARAAVDFDCIQQHSWSPLITVLPTLSDRGEYVEQFRSLRSHLYLHRLQGNLKTILISSGMPGEGKTFVAANLLISLARKNEGRVLLIDADLRRSSLHALLGAPRSPGLMDYLAGNAGLTEIMQRRIRLEDADNHGRALSNVTFIPAGDCNEKPVELVGNRRVEELIASVSPSFDWIVIDAPPVLAVTDGVDLARSADAVLLVVREAVTPYDVAQRAQAAFSNSRVLGFVLNAVKNAPAASYYYSYGEDADSGKNPNHRTKKRSRK